MEPRTGRDSAFTLHLSIPRDARYVSMLRDVARCIFSDLGVPQDDAGDVQLALSEACANVIRHACGTDEYTVGLTVDARGCQVEVVDLGPGWSAAPAVDAADDEHGRGLQLMRALVDDLQFVRQDHTTCVTLRKRWDGIGLGARRPDSRA